MKGKEILPQIAPGFPGFALYTLFFKDLAPAGFGNCLIVKGAFPAFEATAIAPLPVIVGGEDEKAVFVEVIILVGEVFHFAILDLSLWPSVIPLWLSV